MEKKKFNKKTLFIILGVLLLGVLTVLGTYAYFAWSSTGDAKDATIAVSSVNGLGQCNKATDNQKILWPVSSRDKGRIVNINAKQTLSEYAYITWTLTINSINTQDTETNGLKHQSFKYELVNTTTGISYGSGNFQNLNVGDTITFSNNTENLAYDTNYTFTLYLWIDGTIGRNPSDMTDQTYQFSLVCDITGEGTNKVQDKIINPISDFNYVLGSEQSTISTLSADFYNQSTQIISEQSNVSLPVPISIDSDEVLLVRYIGSATEVNIPRTFTINGNSYKPVILSYVNNGSNLSTGVFYHNDNVEDVSFGNNIKYIALNSSSNGYDNYSMSNMFNGCTSLSSLDLTNINLDDVNTYTNALTGVSTTTTITVPNCTQYRAFTSKFGYSYTRLSATSGDYTCYYQPVEYIQSSGTQYIDTGYKPNSNTKMEVEYLPSASYSAFMCIYGTQNSTSSGRFYGLVSATQYYLQVNYSNASNPSVWGFNKDGTTKTGGNGTFTSVLQNVKLTIDNVSVKIESNEYTNTYDMTGYSTWGENINCNYNLTLFARNTAGTVGNNFSGNVYSFKLWDNGSLVRNMIPCYRLSDSVIGMYDLVNGVFYTNANTAANAAAFIAGPNVNS